MSNGSGSNQTPEILTGLDSFKVTKNNKMKKNLQSPSQTDPSLPPSAMLSKPRQQV